MGNKLAISVNKDITAIFMLQKYNKFRNRILGSRFFAYYQTLLWHIYHSFCRFFVFLPKSYHIIKS